jgi:hypothetical protein
MRHKMNWITSKLILVGGLIHIVMATSLLFLPVLITCRLGDQSEGCYSQSYIQQGGNFLGYTLLVVMILAGIVAIYSNSDSNSTRAYVSRWLVVFVSALVFVIAGSGFGIIFLPGALLILAALLPQAIFQK